MRIALVLGTRPEIIKMAPVLYELKKRKIDHFVIHSGQHYSYELDLVFFEQLRLSRPQYRLDVGSQSPPTQIAQIIEGVGSILEKKKPDVVLVQGDTNTVLGGAIAAKSCHIRLGHIEAGLRSYDGVMPEETNRRLADHCSDFLFAPTAHSRDILLGEGIDKKKIFVTGNTIVDSVYHNLSNARIDVLTRLGILPEKYFLASIHRQENVDDKKRFSNLVRSLQELGKKFGVPVVYPIHPRSKKMAKRFGIGLDNITVIEPVDYFAFLVLQKNARLVLTDSGGVQEESCILGVPCVTLRNNTERPETIHVGANIIAGTTPSTIIAAAKKMLGRTKPWKNPFGNGHSAGRIVDILKRQM